MTNEHKLAVIEALLFYIKVAAPHKDEKHITLLEEAVIELQAETTPPPPEQDLF
jgi:hypothetical protein